jgi:hypothetical protein
MARADQGLTGKRIYHFGTGGHHYVGIRCAEPELNNTVLGITASPKEYEPSSSSRPATPRSPRPIQRLFRRHLHQQRPLLPRFDIVTLFHTGEFRTRPTTPMAR